MIAWEPKLTFFAPTGTKNPIRLSVLIPINEDNGEYGSCSISEHINNGVKYMSKIDACLASFTPDISELFYISVDLKGKIEFHLHSQKLMEARHV
jgi:hypothetical protein